MAFCQSCGAEVDGRFCPKCGAAAPGVGGVPPGGTASGASGLTDNVAGALCYSLGILTGILFLVLEPYNKNRNIRFHAFQSIILSAGLMVVFWVIFPLLAVITGGVIVFLAPILGLASFALWLFMIIKTYQNQKVVLPVIGDIAQKQA